MLRIVVQKNILKINIDVLDVISMSTELEIQLKIHILLLNLEFL